MFLIVCNRFFFLVFSLLSIFYFIAFIVFRSDISAGNSLSVPQYSAVPFCCTDVWFFLCDMLFTEINAAAAAIARQKARHKSERPREGDGVIGMVRRSPLPNNMG